MVIERVPAHYHYLRLFITVGCQQRAAKKSSEMYSQSNDGCRYGGVGSHLRFVLFACDNLGQSPEPVSPWSVDIPRGRHLFIFVNQGPPSFDPYRGKTDQTGVDGLQPNSDGLQPKRDELSM